MTIETISTLTGSLGFPIVMCICLMYYIYTSQKQLTEAIMELKETLAEIKGQIAAMQNDKKDGD